MDLAFRSGSRAVDLVDDAIATISRWALAPVFGQATAANAVRLIKSTSHSSPAPSPPIGEGEKK